MSADTARLRNTGAATSGSRRAARFAVATCAGVVLAACASPIRTGYEAGTFPDNMARYAWGGQQACEKPPMTSADQRISPFTMERVSTAIEASLRAKGYERVACAADADFVVTFSIWLDQKVRVNSYPDYWLGVYRRRDLYYRVEATQYTTGTLTVDMFDADSGKPVWHGWANKTVTRGDREAPAEVIREGVAKLLDPFPPQAG